MSPYEEWRALETIRAMLPLIAGVVALILVVDVIPAVWRFMTCAVHLWREEKSDAKDDTHGG